MIVAIVVWAAGTDARAQASDCLAVNAADRSVVSSGEPGEWFEKARSKVVAGGAKLAEARSLLKRAVAESKGAVKEIQIKGNNSFVTDFYPRAYLALTYYYEENFECAFQVFGDPGFERESKLFSSVKGLPEAIKEARKGVDDWKSFSETEIVVAAIEGWEKSLGKNAADALEKMRRAKREYETAKSKETRAALGDSARDVIKVDMSERGKLLGDLFTKYKGAFDAAPSGGLCSPPSGDALPAMKKAADLCREKSIEAVQKVASWICRDVKPVVDRLQELKTRFDAWPCPDGIEAPSGATTPAACGPGATPSLKEFEGIETEKAGLKAARDGYEAKLKERRDALRKKLDGQAVDFARDIEWSPKALNLKASMTDLQAEAEKWKKSDDVPTKRICSLPDQFRNAKSELLAKLAEDARGRAGQRDCPGVKTANLDLVAKLAAQSTIDVPALAAAVKAADADVAACWNERTGEIAARINALRPVAKALATWQRNAGMCEELAGLSCGLRVESAINAVPSVIPKGNLKVITQATSADQTAQECVRAFAKQGEAWPSVVEGMMSAAAALENASAPAGATPDLIAAQNRGRAWKQKVQTSIAPIASSLPSLPSKPEERVVAIAGLVAIVDPLCAEQAEVMASLGSWKGVTVLAGLYRSIANGSPEEAIRSGRAALAGRDLDRKTKPYVHALVSYALFVKMEALPETARRARELLEADALREKRAAKTAGLTDLPDLFPQEFGQFFTR